MKNSIDPVWLSEPESGQPTTEGPWGCLGPEDNPLGQLAQGGGAMGWHSLITCLGRWGVCGVGVNSLAAIFRVSVSLESQGERGPPESSGPNLCLPTSTHCSPKPPRIDGVTSLPSSAGWEERKGQGMGKKFTDLPAEVSVEHDSGNVTVKTPHLKGVSDFYKHPRGTAG